MSEDVTNTRLDYEQTSNNFRMLADIRFKLLLLIPTIAGAGIILSAQIAAVSAVAVGLLGLLATLGVTIYELRNTQLYDATVQRMKTLEGRLGFRATRRADGPGGVHLERPCRSLRFLLIRVVHDLGLSLIYASALGAWTFVAVDAALSVWVRSYMATEVLLLIPVGCGVFIVILTLVEFRRIDKKLRAMMKLPPDVAAGLRSRDVQRD